MARKSERDLLVALDIGTSKIAALVAEQTPEGTLEVVGFGSHPSRGLKRGVVVNIESTVQSIARAIEEAELMAGCDIQSAYTGIAGSHIKSMNSHGIVAIRDREVGESDIDRVIDAAKAVAIPADQKIIHILPQEFIVDEQEGVREPSGMSGVRLEAKVHIVTGAVSAAQNITKCVKRCGLQVNDIVLEQLASSYAVLSDDEKDLGVCMIDIGGGTTDIAVFVDGAIRYTSVIPIAGDQATNDVAVALRTPSQYAEQIKVAHGAVVMDGIDSSQTVEVPHMSSQRAPRLVQRRGLVEVCQARYEELFRLILDDLRRHGFDELILAGVVLTGGGAKIPGAVNCAERILSMPVRLGTPRLVSGLMDVRENPVFATGVGLLMHGRLQNQQTSAFVLSSNTDSIWARMRHWFVNNF